MSSSSERNQIFNEKVRSFKKNEIERNLFFETEKDEAKLIQMAIRLEEMIFLTKHLLIGDHENVNKILSHNKICRKLFQDPTSPFLNVDFLFNEFFPNAAHFLRKKIIKKMSLLLQDEAKGEMIYEKLENVYGKTTAEPILLVCSEMFVKGICLKNPKRFKKAFIEKIFLKFPNSIEDEELIKIYANCEKEVPLDHSVQILNLIPICKISSEALKKFVDGASAAKTLEINSHSSQRFSRRKTKLLFKKYKDRIIENPPAFRRYLDMSKTHNMLTNEEFLSFIKDLLKCDESADPKVLPNYSLAFHWIYFNRKRKEDKTIKQMIVSSMNENWTHLESLDHIMMTDEEIRIKLLDRNIEKNKNDYIYSYSMHSNNLTWEACKPCSLTLPRFKSLISKERDVNERAKLLKLLLFSCTVNKDPASFQNIINYFNTKFRNERFNIRESFFDGCVRFFNKNEEIVTEEHLEGVFEGLKLAKTLKEDNMSYFESAEQLAVKLYVEKKQGEIPEQRLALYFKYIESRDIDFDNDSHKEKNKIILPLYFNYLKSKYQQNTDLFTQYFIFYNISQVVKNFPEELNSIFENHSWFKTETEKIMNDIEEESYSDEIWDLLKPHEQNAIDERMIKCFKILSKLTLSFKHFFKNPKVLLENIQLAMKTYMEEKENLHSSRRYHSNSLKKIIFSRLFLRMKQNGYDEIVQEILKQCSEIVENEKSERIKIEKAMQIIAMLNEKMFIEITNKYLPTEDKISTEEEAHHKTQIQINIAKNLKNISLTKHPNELISFIKAFCRGEYFKFCEGNVSSIVNLMKTQERQEFLLSMMKSYQISQKKLVIRLVYETSTRNEIMPFLIKTLKTEKNHSIIEVITNKLFELLVEDPSEEKWNFFEEAIENLKPENLNILKSFVIEPRVPLQFISKFFLVSIQKFLKEIIEANEEAEKKDITTNYKCFLPELLSLTENFSSDFFNFLIDQRKIIFHEYKEEKLVYTIMKNYLISDKSTEQDVERMIGILKVEKEETSEFSSHFERFVILIFNFVVSNAMFGREKKGSATYVHYCLLIKKLTTFFNEQFEETQAFKTHMTLAFTNSICQVLEPLKDEERKKTEIDVEFWGKKLGDIINEILHEILSKYGDKVSVAVISNLNMNLQQIFNEVSESKLFFRSFGKTFLSPKYPELKPELIQIFEFCTDFEKELVDEVKKEYLDSPTLQILNHHLFSNKRANDRNDCGFGLFD